MKTKKNSSYTFLLISIIGALLAVSCGNVYEPLGSGNSDLDLVEKAQKCLKDNDYDCAVQNYSQIGNPELKTQKLCLVYLGQSGFTLPFLVDILKKGGTNMLGNLTNSLLPWSAERQTAVNNALTQCADYVTATASTSQLAILLDTISRITNCAVRIGKVDKFRATSDSDTDCNTTPATIDGKISQADISDNSGVITVGNPGMCTADVTACRDAIFGVSATTLQNLGFTDIKNAYDALPADLKDNTAVTNAIRAAIRSVLPN